MYHFVYQDPQPRSLADRRRVLLQNSDARSHAARISHVNKRIQNDPSAQLDDRLLSGIPPAKLRQPTDVEGQASRSQKEDRYRVQRWRLVQREQKRPKPRQRQYACAEGKRDLPGLDVSPFPILGQSTRDPFDSYPNRRLPEHVDWAVRFMLECIKPQMFSTLPKCDLAIAKRDWRSYSLHDDLLFHSQIVVACNLSLAAEDNPLGSSVAENLRLARMHHYSKAIRLLEQEIKSLNGGPPSDSLMVSVLRMGISADVDQESPLPECHRRSPLATAQCIHLYGKLSIMPSYAKALHSLVERRGGVHAVKRVGWSDWLVLADLYNSSRTGDRLWYPRVRPYESIVCSGKHVPDAKALYLSKRLGSGFHDLDDVLVPANVREAIRRAVEATVALDHYYRREDDRPLLPHIVLAANEAQRGFLELCAEDVFGMERLVQNCCRLAGLIYSDIVLFPLPSCTRVKSRLAGELKQLLEESEQKGLMVNKAKDSIASPLEDMWMWVLAMGGIAASFTVHRPFFVKRLRSRLRIRGTDHPSGWTWPEFKKLVSRFLWWDPVVDSPAMGLWLKVTTDELHKLDDEKERQEAA